MISIFLKTLYRFCKRYTKFKNLDTKGHRLQHIHDLKCPVQSPEFENRVLVINSWEKG